MSMLPVTYGYARVSKSDDDARNLDTQLRLLANHGIRDDLIFTDVASGRTMNRPGWLDLMGRVRPGDTIVVGFLDRFSRNFEGGRPDSGGADRTRHRHRRDQGEHRHQRRQRRSEVLPALVLAQGAYQVDSASERIKLGLDRARAGGKRVGRPPALTQEQVEQCRRMADEGAGLRQIARVMQCSPATVKKTLVGYQPQSGAQQRREPPVG